MLLAKNTRNVIGAFFSVSYTRGSEEKIQVIPKGVEPVWPQTSYSPDAAKVEHFWLNRSYFLYRLLKNSSPV